MSDAKTQYLSIRKKIISKYFGKLNDRQKEAVLTINGPLLILAGAGSGKTTVLINRIANMVKFGSAYESDNIPDFIGKEEMEFLRTYESENGNADEILPLIADNPVKPWNILAITFTNKAAGELKERLEKMLGETGRDVNAATFHSICVRILRREIDKLGYDRSFTIYDGDDSERVIKSCIKELNIDDKMFSPRSVLNEISRAKDDLKDPEDMDAEAGSDYRKKLCAKIYGAYAKKLKESNAVDFDDIIILTVKLFSDFPEVLQYYRDRFKYIMVDEYQDTNNAQYLFVSLLAEKSGNICVVGDDDQSIYKFRGANIENILNFEKQFKKTKVIKLEQNYRSTKTRLNAANGLIAKNFERKEKTLWTENQEGEKIIEYRAADEQEEALFVAEEIRRNAENGSYKDNVVLYRMNAQSNAIEKCFVNHGIPYKIVGGLRFFERKEIKDVMAYLSVVNNLKDNLRLKRIINEPKRGIGDTTVANAEEIAENLGLSLFEVISESENYPQLVKKSAALKQFSEMMLKLSELAERVGPDDLFDEVIESSGYIMSLRALGAEGETKIENIKELKSNIINYMKETPDGDLEGFLEEAALYTELDSLDDGNAVTLMTIHSAKGLEFPNVFIVGMEDEIFPGIAAIYNEEEIEEERRLAYVAITRAQRKLYLVNTVSRMIFGKTGRNRPSRFLREIPEECVIHMNFNDGKSFSEYQKNEKKSQPKYFWDIGINRETENEYVVKKSSTGFKIAKFKAGDSVKHNVFGIGSVISVKEMGDDALVEVNFERVGVKKIMAKYAKLEKV